MTDWRVTIRTALDDRPRGETSLYWLSKASGVRYATLHDYMSGKTAINSDALQAIAGCLGLDLARYSRAMRDCPAGVKTGVSLDSRRGRRGEIE
jgi:Helix-turn-helix